MCDHCLSTVKINGFLYLLVHGTQIYFIGRNILIQFKIWERGNIEMDNFEKDLLNCVKHALCDVFLEYHLFCTPLCHIPKPLQSSVHSSRRESIVRRSSFTHLRQSVHSSGSSAATTPKLIKPHANLKKFFSEPTTPNDMRSESPGIKVKDDLSLVAESPKSLPRDYNTAVEISPEEIEKRRYSLMEQRRQSPVVAKKKMSRYKLYWFIKKFRSDVLFVT